MPLDDDAGEAGVAAWVRRWWRALLAELLATMLLVFLGVASVIPVKPDQDIPLTNPALAFGLVIIMNIQAFGATSGAHMNPAVTVAAVAAGRLRAAAAAGYVLAQVAGALLGFGALVALLPAHALRNNAGCTWPAHVSPAAALCVEAAMTGLLALLCCGLWTQHDPARPDHTAPLKFGLGVAGLVYAGGEMTGTSLNPARSLAPAIFHNFWEHHWVYWLGPLGGSAAATLLHRHVLCAARGVARDEALPLRDKPAA
ncbi:glycerol uptake facilitator protein-like 6 [Achroia grisella]|uniref:glycerol uptake facilitator protein-like 6 n=1 Tax=Achroia grisella TaxID=688607 RepID=UPI0027D326D4|nr:glycerol uptake facilitator protein-like 6 [Achroia grisella]